MLFPSTLHFGKVFCQPRKASWKTSSSWAQGRRSFLGLIQGLAIHCWPCNFLTCSDVPEKRRLWSTVSTYKEELGGNIIWGQCLGEISQSKRKDSLRGCFVFWSQSTFQRMRQIRGGFEGCTFSVSSFLAISCTPSLRCNVANIWKFKAPPGVHAFGWLAIRGRILTMDNLRHRGVIVVNACPLRLEDEETIDHLLNCKVSYLLWRSIFGCT